MIRLRRRPERTPPETIIALIDVVFFLLVFFMLIGRMDATSPFEVIPPIGFTGADLPGGGATVAISRDGRQSLDGTEVDRVELLTAIERRLQQDPALLIRINGHHATELGQVLPLVAEIEALGARDVVLVVTPSPP